METSFIYLLMVKGSHSTDSLFSETVLKKTWTLYRQLRETSVYQAASLIIGFQEQKEIIEYNSVITVNNIC